MLRRCPLHGKRRFVIGFHDLCNLVLDVWVVPLAGFVKAFQLCKENGFINFQWLANMDQSVLRGTQPLLFHEHFFVELLTGTKTCKLNLYIFSNFKA